MNSYTIITRTLSGQCSTIEEALTHIEEWANEVLLGYAKPGDVDIIVDYRAITRYVSKPSDSILATARYRANSGAVFVYTLLGKETVSDDSQPVTVPTERGDGEIEQSSGS